MTHGCRQRGRLYVAALGLGMLAGCTDLAVPEQDPLASGNRTGRTAAAEMMALARSTAQPQAAAPAADATKPFAFEAPVKAGNAPTACRIDGFVMPASAKVYAAGAYAGKETDFQIDQSGHPATAIQVAVNEPAAPVVLLLGAYEPTVWSIGWTRGTRIAAVLVTGYHRQQLTGLPAGVPQLVSTHDNRGPCGYAYVGGEGSAKLNPLARTVFGRAVDVAYAARDGRAVVGKELEPGTSLVTDAAAKPKEDFRLKGVPPAGQAGIDAALREGILRPATLADVSAWEAARQRSAGAPDIPRIEGAAPSRAPSVPHRGYTVLQAFAIPAGLYGAHSATFFVAPGVPAPTGNPGHSEVRFIETGSCTGPICGRR